MLKYLLGLILFVSCFVTAAAQTKSDTLMYYVTNSDDIVTDKAKADYVLFILPRKEENGKKLFPVIEYYTNGQRKLVATSSTNKFPLVMEGSYLRFFPNGKRQGSVTVQKGKPVGDELSYYPNGKFYSLRKHEKDKVQLIECRDSTGTVLAENGNGEWLEFDGLFTNVTERGSVKDGLKEGIWSQFSGIVTYEKGAALTIGYAPVQSRIILSGEDKYLPKDSSSVYKGNINTIQKFINSKADHAMIVREHGLSKQMYVGFYVEPDGSLNSFTAFASPSKAVSEELIKLIRSSSPWVSADNTKLPKRTPVILPIFFPADSLATDSSANKVFAKSDVPPDFPGGLSAFGKFLEKAVHYPSLESEHNVMGRVFATFVVEKDGSIGDLHIVRTPSVGLAEETLRVMRLSPKWKPGVQNGMPVRVQYTMPINFSLGTDAYNNYKNPALNWSKKGDPAYINNGNDIVDMTAKPDSSFVPVETPPDYPGGLTALGEYLRKSVRYPDSDIKNKIQGKVHISFVIEKDGSLTEFKIVSAPSKSLGEEALRVMKRSPKWKPGIQNGRPVRVQYTVPVNFTLGDSSY